MLVGLPQLQRGLGMSKFGRLGEELHGIDLVLEHVVAVARLVHQSEVVGRLVVLEVGRFRGPLEPLQTFAVSIDQPHVAGQARLAQSRRGSGMVLRRRRAVELHGLGVVLPTPPAKLVAERRAVSCLGVAVFAGGDEQGEGAVVVRLIFVEETRRVPVAQVILGEWVTPVG